MAADWFLIASQVSVIACALVAGVFLTFSDFVMKSLAATKPAGGIEAMQVINHKVFKTVFMVLLLGMSALSPLLIAYGYFYVPGAASAWVIAGGAIYLAGVFLVTIICNVPMNQRLDRMDHTSHDAASYWRRYVPAWSFWNHVRTAASAGSAVCYLVASAWLVQVA
jgi:uncharacterized membrane protein